MAFYAVADAARILRVPPATIRTWAFGRSYLTKRGDQHWPSLIRASDPRGKRLSFRNLVELHVLSVLRGRQLRVENIRKAQRFMREHMATDHPLADCDTQTDSVDVYVDFLGRLMNATRAQVELRPMVQRYLQRIERDEHGLARRLYPITRADDAAAPRLVVIDPLRRFGRPVLASTNLETYVVAERFEAGESARELADDFRISLAEVEEAVRFETALRSAA